MVNRENEESNSQDSIDTPVVIEEPEQEIDVDEIGKGISLSESEEGTSHQTDLQAVLQKLHPTYRNKRLNDLLQPIMASRVFPDNFLDLNYLLVMSLIEEGEGDDDIDIIDIITPSIATFVERHDKWSRLEALEDGASDSENRIRPNIVSAGL